MFVLQDRTTGYDQSTFSQIKKKEPHRTKFIEYIFSPVLLLLSLLLLLIFASSPCF
jgi:hypothetical protein